MNQHRPRPRGALAGGLVVALLVATAGCTSDPEAPRETAPSPLPERSVGAAPTLAAKPVPLEVTVAKVVGERLRKDQRRRLEKQVAGVISRYFDDAYLGGEYPRRDFSGAFAAFTGGAAERAAKDRDILTNATVGAETEAVVPRAQLARLDVLVPRRFVAGLTARVRLVFFQDRTGGADQKVTVKGRLMLSRNSAGEWQIFGYDVSRSSARAGKGGGR
ncbi:MAG TPA: hypothetical protein VFR87_12420 [Nocardioidaceae bacterium]|nr:hypothetical protein [Nocardioidaceae bacterium]